MIIITINKMEQTLSKIKDQESFDLTEETVIPIKTSVPQDIGAPFPHVISYGLKTYLLFYIGTNRPGWDPSANTIQVLDSQTKDYVALFQFQTYSVRFGGVNDEVLHGHPLYEHGLESYEMYEIRNSSWIKEQRKINSVHPDFKNELGFWDARKHYIFTFHDNIFECIAENYNIQVYRGKLSHVMALITKMLFS